LWPVLILRVACFDMPQETAVHAALGCGMAGFIYRCPTTTMTVQGWIADDGSSNGESYTTVTCLACQQVHLVNPTTGRVVGDDEKD
jgi:hypothetical protein